MVQNARKARKKEGYQQPGELPILSDKDNSQETSDHVPSLVSKRIQLQMLSLTIAVLPLIAGSRNKKYLGDRDLSHGGGCLGPEGD